MYYAFLQQGYRCPQNYRFLSYNFNNSITLFCNIVTFDTDDHFSMILLLSVIKILHFNQYFIHCYVYSALFFFGKVFYKKKIWNYCIIVYSRIIIIIFFIRMNCFLAQNVVFHLFYVFLFEVIKQMISS